MHSKVTRLLDDTITENALIYRTHIRANNTKAALVSSLLVTYPNIFHNFYKVDAYN